MTLPNREEVSYLPLDEQLRRIRILQDIPAPGPTQRRRPRTPLEWVALAFFLAVLFYGLAVGLHAQAPGIRPLTPDPAPAVQFVQGGLTDEEQRVVREALLAAAALIKDPGVPGDRIVSATPAEEQEQRAAARKVREALAVFGLKEAR